MNDTQKLIKELAEKNGLTVTVNESNQLAKEFLFMVENKGFTTEEVNNAIEKAKDTFGNELRQAFDDAKAQYSV